MLYQSTKPHSCPYLRRLGQVEQGSCYTRVRVGVNLVQFSREEDVRPAESEHRDLGVG